LSELGKAMVWRGWGRRKRAETSGAGSAEVLARAARLGITPDRVLEEYRRIAFANLRHIIDWDDGQMKFKSAEELSEDDVAAISEIVQSAAKEGKPYRVKLYDKRTALDAIARYLGMVPLAGSSAAQEGEAIIDDGEDPRRTLARKLARLAAEDNAGRLPREPDPG
jgi:hypothetical protein